MTRLTHALDAPPWRRVDGAILETARAIRHAYDQALADLGVSLSDAMLISYLAEVEPLTQTRLAAQLNIGRAATGARVDKLEAQGAVRREPDPTDRRVWLVHVTDNGRALVESIAAVDEELRKQLRAGIARHELQQLASILVRLQGNLAEIQAASSHPNSAD